LPIPFRFFAQDSLEATGNLIQLNIEASSNSEQGAESRVGSAALKLADAVELSSNPLSKPLLGQTGRPAQFLNCSPKRSMSC